MKFQDSIVNDARKECIEKASISRAIVKKYNTKVENGHLIIGELK